MESLKLTEYPPGIQLKLTFSATGATSWLLLIKVQFCQKDTEGPKQQQAHEANIQWTGYPQSCKIWEWPPNDRQAFRYQMKIWSSHLLDNLSNCLMTLKNSGDSTGFEPMTSAMPVQCSNQLSYQVTQLGETWAQQIDLLSTEIKWRYDLRSTLPQLKGMLWKHISFIRHSFHGKTWAQQIDLLSTVWLRSSVG